MHSLVNMFIIINCNPLPLDRDRLNRFFLFCKFLPAGSFKTTRSLQYILVPQMFTADGHVCCLIDRSDQTLEDIIYKLVPKLQESKTFYEDCS